MKYEVIRACVIRGSTHKVGQVIELDDAMAKQMMAIGRVAPYSEPIIEDRSIGLSDETTPRKRSRPKKVAEYDAG